MLGDFRVHMCYIPKYSGGKSLSPYYLPLVLNLLSSLNLSPNHLHILVVFLRVGAHAGNSIYNHDSILSAGYSQNGQSTVQLIHVFFCKFWPLTQWQLSEFSHSHIPLAQASLFESRGKVRQLDLVQANYYKSADLTSQPNYLPTDDSLLADMIIKELANRRSSHNHSHQIFRSY